MFDQLFEEPRTLRRHRDGPLANERLQFLAYHVARGSVRTTLRRIDNFMLAIIEEMTLQTTDKVSIGEIEAAADQRVFRGSRNGPRKYGLTSRWWFIHVGQRWLAQLGRLRVPEAPPQISYAHEGSVTMQCSFAFIKYVRSRPQADIGAFSGK